MCVCVCLCVFVWGGTRAERRHSGRDDESITRRGRQVFRLNVTMFGEAGKMSVEASDVQTDEDCEELVSPQLLVTNGNWWLLVVSNGNWWLLMVTNGNWWLLVVTNGNWWLGMETDVILMYTDGNWWRLILYNGY